MADFIRYEVDDDGIAQITLERPEKRNAMTYAMLEDFIATVRRAGEDSDARVILLTGSGGSFCAGTDLSDLQTVPGAERPTRGSVQDSARWWPLCACPKPVIAAIDGPAVGMGAEFTSQCDVRIASDRARFAWNFVHRGLVPDTGAGTWLLPRLIGMTAALRLLSWCSPVSSAISSPTCRPIAKPSKSASARPTTGRGWPPSSSGASRSSTAGCG